MTMEEESLATVPFDRAIEQVIFHFLFLDSNISKSCSL